MVSQRAVPLFKTFDDFPLYYKLIENNSVNLFVGVCIDSRSVEKDSLFVCLKGERVDGHEYIESAVDAGASYCLIEKGFYDNNVNRIEALNDEKKCGFIIVDNTLSYFQSLAKKYLEKMTNLKKIGITGSSGKTTTKEIIADILSEKYCVYRNLGNLNSEIGLPLSVFGVKEDHEIAVFEMGMNRVGEMDILSDILRPDYAVITNIGDAHIGILGSRKNIALEKRKIFKFIDESGFAYIAEDEVYFDFLVENLAANIEKYGPGSVLSFNTVEDLGLNGYVLHFDEGDIAFPMYGKYNLINLFAGIALAKSFLLSFEELKAGVEKIKPLFGRSQIVKGDVTLIKDCYNANPESMMAAINSFAGIDWNGSKVLVLGDMLELGKESDDLHENLLIKIVDTTFDSIFIFGEAFEKAFKKLKLKSKHNIFSSNDRSEFESKLLSELKKEDLVLLKGSRSMKLEGFVKNLQ